MSLFCGEAVAFFSAVTCLANVYGRCFLSIAFVSLGNMISDQNMLDSCVCGVSVAQGGKGK